MILNSQLQTRPYLSHDFDLKKKTNKLKKKLTFKNAPECKELQMHSNF